MNQKEYTDAMCDRIDAYLAAADRVEQYPEVQKALELLRSDSAAEFSSRPPKEVELVTGCHWAINEPLVLKRSEAFNSASRGETG